MKTLRQVLLNNECDKVVYIHNNKGELLAKGQCNLLLLVLGEALLNDLVVASYDNEIALI